MMTLVQSSSISERFAELKSDYKKELYAVNDVLRALPKAAKREKIVHHYAQIVCVISAVTLVALSILAPHAVAALTIVSLAVVVSLTLAKRKRNFEKEKNLLLEKMENLEKVFRSKRNDLFHRVTHSPHAPAQ